MGKIIKVRDPVHDIIEFDLNKSLESKLWEIVQTKEFQRLRRIYQLGFSHYVYPGACHSRLAHSLGVYKIAKDLVQIIEKEKARCGFPAHPETISTAIAAALLHDVGHGMFSHAFERVGKALKKEEVIASDKYFRHETVTQDIIKDSSITEILNRDRAGFSEDVSEFIKEKGKYNKDIYKSIVSSQFDADRLDYMQRDRIMSGIRDRRIDVNWILGNLTVGSVGDKSYPTLVVEKKGIYAIENYLLSLFHLYPTLYYHKTTRSAEAIFVQLMVGISKEIVNGNYLSLGHSNPIVKFIKNPNLENFLELDDSVFFASLHILKNVNIDKYAHINFYANCLINRELYKCLDLKCDDYNISKIEKRIVKFNDCKNKIKNVIIDEGERSCYKKFEKEEYKEHIYVKLENGEIRNISEHSDVIRNIRNYKFCRIYYNPLSVNKEDLLKVIEESKK